MMSRPSGLIGLFLATCLVVPALAVPVAANAEELNPFDIPEETGPFDAPGFDTPLPDFIEPAPGEPAAEAPPPPIPVDTGPPIIAPPVDAYVDLSFNGSRLKDFGYSDTPGGYRFIAGFIFKEFSSDRLASSAEVGYVRIGVADASATTVTRNIPIPLYDNIKTDRSSLDLSTLTFGLREGYKFAEQLEAFGRVGLHFYHTAQQDQTAYSYTSIPNVPNPGPRPDDIQPTFSTADVGTDYYLSGGLAWKVAAIPSVYAEYSIYSIGNKQVTSTSLGFLLNF